MNTNFAKNQPSATPNRPMLKVLLVDDDSFQLDLISGILNGLGLMDITQASSGERALQELTVNPHGFQLTLLDLHMPGMDGFKFMESMANVGYTGALIIVSGQSDDVMYAASLVAKLRRFTLLGTVAKPVAKSALSALLSKLSLS